MTTTHLQDNVFPIATDGLPACGATTVVSLADGDRYDLRIGPVAKELNGSDNRMLAYNGSIPGPTLRVAQGSEIEIRVRNDGDLATTVHWHGLRLDNQFDGVPVATQAPIEIGGEFVYRVRFPDDGLYWYHPHVREDYGLEMGLYGNIIVEPAAERAWPAVDREAIVTLDDVLIEDGHIAPFRKDGPTHTAMGRFGNTMLIAGSTDLTLRAQAGEVVRFFLTNTANTRIFNVAIAGARMKLIGGDNGRHETEAWIDTVLLAPSERAVVDVLFDAPRTYTLEHRTPDGSYSLGSVVVSPGSVDSTRRAEFETLHTNDALSAERERLESERQRRPDKTLVFTASMPLLYGSGDPATSYVCPMHPEVTSNEPGTCPKCGMKLVPSEGAAPTMPGHNAGHSVHGRDTRDGLEWEDLMPEINARTDRSNMIWRIVDEATGAENRAIDWRFTVGDRVKIRLVNTMDSDHPMHHPFHIHGAGRFLVLERDGRPTDNLVWKDSVLVRAGETVDLVLDITEPGLWMAHCHIAEHHGDGMMFSFRVDPA